MISKKPYYMLLVCSLCFVKGASAEPQRAQFTKENKFPSRHGLELGAFYRFTEFIDKKESLTTKDADLNAYGLSARFGLHDKLSLEASVPVHDFNSKAKDDTSVGDISIGLQLKAFEHIYDYPYVIPHVRVDLGNGEKNKLTGDGENEVTVGVSAGTVVNEVCHFIIDGSYHTRKNQENEALLGTSFIYDLDETFSILAEVQLSNEKLKGESGNPILIQGGFIHHWNNDLQLSFLGGGGKNTSADVFVEARSTYTF